MLKRLLDAGRDPKVEGEGAFLQTSNVKRVGKGWVIDGKPLDVNRTYRVAINDYLLKGREDKLSFLGERKGEVREVGTKGELREAVIAQLQADNRPTPAP